MDKTQPIESNEKAERPVLLPAPAMRALIVMLTCLSLWLLLAAPRLKTAAEASPTGARRAVSLAILRPLAWFSENSGLSTATGALESAVGRDPDAAPGGVLDIDAALDELDLPEVPPEEALAETPSAAPEPGPDTPDGKREEEPREPADIALREPSERYKLRVAVIGDSFAQGIGNAIERATRNSYVHVLNLGRIATGLARADYFDWVAAMDKIQRRYQPDVVLVMLGGNDKQSIIFPGGRVVGSGDPDWGSAYRQRIAALLGEMGSKTHAVWVGLPPVKDKGKSDLFEDYNNMYRSTVEARRNSGYIDIWDGFAGEDGRYKPYGRGPNGDVVLLREQDGSHFTAAGYDLIVQRVITLMTGEWDLPRKILE